MGTFFPSATTSNAIVSVPLGPGYSRAAYGKDAGSAIVRFGQRREGLMRFRLIPIANGVEVVRAMIRVPVFNRHPNVLAKRDRALKMPSVEAITSSNFFRILDVGTSDKRIRIGLNLSIGSAEVPGAVVVIFGSATGDDWQRAIVNENHFIAFTKPVILVLQH
jgi:hypothetical protein